MQPLWTPTETQIERSNLHEFIYLVNEKHGLAISNYPELYQWSLDHTENFWAALWDFAPMVYSQPYTQVLKANKNMLGSRWFLDAELNYAENLLQHRTDEIAIYFQNESGDKQHISFNQLHQRVASLSAHLQELGIKPGDVVAGVLPNIPETIIAMLAASSLGAIWTCCATDFGLQAILDRLEQVQPKVLFCVESHSYNNKKHDHCTDIKTLQEKLSLQQTIVVPYLNNKVRSDAININTIFARVENHIDFKQLPFDHPLFILYSSGTTGKPKCIVHGAGGTLLQHYKEHILHTDLTANDTLFYFTSCGWMMWNWQVSALAVGTSIVCYDGSPMLPKDPQCFDLIDALNINVFGTSAKYLAACENKKLQPKQTHRLDSLRSILSTGSTLLPSQYNYVYSQIKSDLQLASISGGTDIVSCFALGCPTLPVYAGELQCRGLGLAVEIFNESAASVINQSGELVCTKPFPCMPVKFWDDADNSKYHAAYFEKFPGVWTHGDYAKITERGSVVIYGRSDSTLNPNGIRIGTSEIYRQVESFIDIDECLITSQAWHGSERIILFVKLQPDCDLTDELCQRIKQQIKTNLSPHHLPAKIIALPDIPKTINGKIVELAVKNTLHGRSNQNLSALANPEILELIAHLPELQA